MIETIITYANDIKRGTKMTIKGKRAELDYIDLLTLINTFYLKPLYIKKISKNKITQLNEDLFAIDIFKEMENGIHMKYTFHGTRNEIY